MRRGDRFRGGCFWQLVGSTYPSTCRCRGPAPALELYGRGLQLEVADRDKLVECTAGASGAFIRELLRKAAVFAAEDNGSSPLVVRDPHIEEALAELVVAGGSLTQSLLGAHAPNSSAARTS